MCVEHICSETSVQHVSFPSLHRYVDLNGLFCIWTLLQLRVEVGILISEVEAPLGEMDSGLAVGAEGVQFRLPKFVRYLIRRRGKPVGWLL